MRHFGWLALAFVGCGPGKTKFVPEYADGYCAYLFACSDPAQLTFDGLLTVDDCLAVVGPEVEALMSTCKYHAGKAHDCLKQLEVATCAPEGEPVDQGLPGVCIEVWTECGPPADPTVTTSATEVPDA